MRIWIWRSGGELLHTVRMALRDQPGAREQLLQSAGSEPIYRSMIADATSPHSCCALEKPTTEFQCQGLELDYVIPREGTIVWFDLLVIPADAPHPGNAHLFLNYLLRPEVIAAISNETRYAALTRAQKLLKCDGACSAGRAAPGEWA